jgi:hypothetical protein
MNPLIFAVLYWERELEIQRQALRDKRYDPDEFITQEPETRPAGRRPVFTRLTKPRTQTPCECA